jgi:hypothetical protein
MLVEVLVREDLLTIWIRECNRKVGLSSAARRASCTQVPRRKIKTEL